MRIFRHYLDTAKENHIRTINGRSVLVFDASTSLALVRVAFFKGHQTGVPLRFGGEVQHNGEYDRVYLSYPAQPGQWVDLAFLEEGERLVPADGVLSQSPVVDPADCVSVMAETGGAGQAVFYTVPADRELIVTQLRLRSPSTGKVTIEDADGTEVYSWVWDGAAALMPEAAGRHRMRLGAGYTVSIYSDGAGSAWGEVHGYLIQESWR